MSLPARACELCGEPMFSAGMNLHTEIQSGIVRHFVMVHNYSIDDALFHALALEARAVDLWKDLDLGGLKNGSR